MKPLRDYPEIGQTNLQPQPANTTHEKFHARASFKGAWFAIGNMLLLIGGDDSVEIEFNSKSSTTAKEQHK